MTPAPEVGSWGSSQWNEQNTRDQNEGGQGRSGGGGYESWNTSYNDRNNGQSNWNNRDYRGGKGSRWSGNGDGKGSSWGGSSRDNGYSNGYRSSYSSGGNSWNKDSWGGNSRWGGKGGRGGYSKGGGSYEDMGWDAGINWDYEKLPEFNKDFYVPHPIVEGRSEGEVEDIRHANRIQLIRAQGLKCPKPVTTFEESNFPDYLVNQFLSDSLDPIQMQGWPVASSGRDLVGVAETGSGKTLAYLLPAIVHIAAQPSVEQGDGPVALVLVPTRELSIQVNREAQQLAESMLEVGSVPLRIACVYGGQPKRQQERELWAAPELLVGTPGRLIDFLQIGATNLKRVTYLVIDEADEMLALGFARQLDSICSAIRPDRQTLMWSATWPKEIQDLARKHCRENPVHINIGSESLAACHQVMQDFVFLEHAGTKEREFMNNVIPKVWNILMTNETAKALVFCNTKREVDQLTERMRREGYNAVCIHSDKDQSEREWVFSQYRDGETRLLVATNLMGRGVDIKNIQFVINYDMPQTIEEYVHRIGRTARAGARGTSITLFTAQDGRHAESLVNILNEAGQNIPEFLVELKRNP
ncbi:hypothetical protein FOL47_004612 [Perkinsus chesapeaki]|uniref:RNA helicase n=1 Tax=Perkinsus chesapeaki TaxID=330153 RepID=A0A7J6M1Q0_PERCH|nr:hypothetical protein FOL47_004612 [Perkinsus chesapeaki]